LLTAETDRPIKLIEPKQSEAMPVEGAGQNEQQPPMHEAHAAPHGYVKANWAALSRACCARLETTELWRFIKSLR
jgi:hypothetical protein